jgi:hypothetical protein
MKSFVPGGWKCSVRRNHFPDELSFPHSWLITALLTRVRREGATNGAETTHPSGSPRAIPSFCEVHVARSLVFWAVLWRSLYSFTYIGVQHNFNISLYHNINKKTVCDIKSQVFGPLFTGGVERFRNDVLDKIINTENKCHDNILLLNEIWCSSGVCRKVGHVRVDRGQNLKKNI